MVPSERIQISHPKRFLLSGEFVLYWMECYHRFHWNYSLDRAIEWATTHQKPLLVVEALLCESPWSCTRFHRFLLEGMANNSSLLKGQTSITYYSFVQRQKGESDAFFASLGQKACMIVLDDFPCVDQDTQEKKIQEVPCLVEKIDSNGLFPMRSTQKNFTTAHSFRRFLQKELPSFLHQFPKQKPFEGISLPSLSAASLEWLSKQRTGDEFFQNPEILASLPISSKIPASPIQGGCKAALKKWKYFMKHNLCSYPDNRNNLSIDATSQMSAYLHFGMISSHEMFSHLIQQENWSLPCVSTQTNGKRSGWWGMSPPAEAFLDQLVTWRELGFNAYTTDPNVESFDSLPDWAWKTLQKHATDEREWLYSLNEFEQAQTHDALWNAAQNQLVREGCMFNYLRMLWGKKIVEWSASPQEALAIMMELNNRYALDGRNPNSTSGIFWILGRYDRAWGPERPVFGTVRFMSSQSTQKKIKTRDYVEQYKT